MRFLAGVASAESSKEPIWVMSLAGDLLCRLKGGVAHLWQEYFIAFHDLTGRQVVLISDQFLNRLQP